MTASEKLRLMGNFTNPHHGPTPMWVATSLVNVLPEIIAVVEAGQIAGEVHGCPQLTKSLAALDARLTADGNDKEGGN